MMNHCFICRDKKRYELANRELEWRSVELKKILRKLETQGGKTSDNMKNQKKVILKFPTMHSAEPRLMCGRCPHVAGLKFTSRERQLNRTLIEVVTLCDTLSGKERERTLTELNNLFRGDYPSISRAINHMKTKKLLD